MAATEEIFELKSMGLNDIIYIVDANEGTDILQFIRTMGDKGQLKFKYRGDVYNWWKIFDPNLGSFVEGIASEILYPKSYNETVAKRESPIFVRNNYDSNYFEKQKSLGCGRHALNNLFGEDYFIKYGLPDPKDYNIETLVEHLKVIPIPLMDVCDIYLKIASQFSEENFCQTNENYDVKVIQLGLDVLGVRHDTVNIPTYFTNEHEKIERAALIKLREEEEYDMAKYIRVEMMKIFVDERGVLEMNRLYENENKEKNVLGYIINFNRNHWVALKKHPNGSEVKLVDSMKKNQPIYQNFEEFVKEMYFEEEKVNIIYHIIKVSHETNDSMLHTKLNELISFTEATIKGRNEQELLELSKNEIMIEAIRMFDELSTVDERFINEFNRNIVGSYDMKISESIEYSSKIITIFERHRENFKVFLLYLFEQWNKGISIGNGNPKIIIELYNKYILEQPHQSAGSSKPKKYRLNY